MSHITLKEHHEGTEIIKHHKKPYSLPVEEVRSWVCSKVKESLEAFGYAKCDGCSSICITKK